MSTTRTLPVACALALVVFTAAPRPARAQFDFSAFRNLVLVGTVALATGLATDVGIAAQLAATGHVTKGWAVTGILAWGTLTLGDLIYTVNASAAARLDPGWLELTGVCVGSLAWSLFAASRGPPKIAVTPTPVAGPGGKTAPGLAVVGHF